MSPAINFSELFADIPKGSWVAISEDHQRVVAFGEDSEQVFDRAQHAGEAVPLIMWLPQEDLMLCL